METCEWCGKKFNRMDASEEFVEAVCMLSYDNIHRCLCGSCAVEAIESQVEGIYFETCEECGEEFDYITENSKFIVLYGDSDLMDAGNGKILCFSCASERYEKDLYESDL